MISFQNNLGFGFKSDQFTIFYGNISAHIKNLKIHFPDFDFKKIKQTHSDIVLENSVDDESYTGDAHYTGVKNRALLISTADCMPIMVCCVQTSRVLAIHAGWRGVENKITEKSLQKMIETGSSDKSFKICIGPHILQNSFEVNHDAYALLAKAHYGLNERDYVVEQNGKYYIDLNKIVISQIENVIQKPADIEFINIDTKTTLLFHSYRRDQKTLERNLSFVVRT